MKFEDLTGKQFGNWVVLHKTKSMNGKSAYQCKCVCGVEKPVLYNYLVSGKSKSCGCVNNRCHESMIGKKYGKLTVISKAAIRKNSRKLRYVVVCECGNKFEVDGSLLRNGTKIDCGCGNLERKRKSVSNWVDITNQKFGRLTAVERQYDDNNNYIGWLCKCECGNLAVVTLDKLKSGNTKSCGCYKKYFLSETRTIDEIGHTYGYLRVYAFSHKDKNGTAYWKCKCLNCGGDTIVCGTLLRNGNTTSCGCVASRGELTIRNTFNKHLINYKTQYSFCDLKGFKGRRLRFDFALLDCINNMLCLIEFDGEYHNDIKNHGWNTPEHMRQTQLHDRLKNEYCAAHNIPLIRIPYTDLPKLQASDDYLLSLIAPYLSLSA